MKIFYQKQEDNGINILSLDDAIGADPKLVFL